MVSITNLFKKKHVGLDQSQIDDHISDLQKHFDSLWTQETDTLYRSLMQVLGTDFTYPQSVSIEYKADVTVLPRI